MFKINFLFDIKIENTSLQWNKEPIDWINSDNSIDEVGCIHTTQGYDLNYTGVIFGNEIIYDKDKDEIVILKENYFDYALFYNDISCLSDINCSGLSLYNSLVNSSLSSTTLFNNLNTLSSYSYLNISSTNNNFNNLSSTGLIVLSNFSGSLNFNKVYDIYPFAIKAGIYCRAKYSNMLIFLLK